MAGVGKENGGHHGERHKRTVYHCVLAPAGTPEPIAKKLETELMRIARLPEVSQRVKETSSVMGSTSEDFVDFITRETPVWAAIIKENNIRLGN